MNLKQIEYMVSVVKNGSFSLAAKECFVTVQAVSKAIADLERELGESLFVRESRGVKPTEFDLAFYDKAVDAMASFKELEMLPKTYAANGAPARGFRLAMYAPAFNNSDLMRVKIAQFTSKLLGQPVEVPQLSENESVRQLESREIDAFISIGTFSHPDMDCATIGTPPTSIVVVDGHPLAQCAEVTLEQINQFPVLRAPEFDSFNHAIFGAYRKHGLTSPSFFPKNDEEYRDFLYV